MPIRVIISIIFSIIAYLGYSQTPFIGGLSLGINASQIGGDGYQGYNKFGYQIAGTLEKEINERIDFHSEIQYQRRGSFKPSQPDKGIYTTYKIVLHYVDIPLLIRFDYKKIQLETGLIPGIQISNYEEDINGEPNKYMLNYNPVDLQFSAGIIFGLSENIDLNWRFAYSVIPIADRVEILRGIGIGGGSFNNVVAFSLQYKFAKAVSK